MRLSEARLRGRRKISVCLCVCSSVCRRALWNTRVCANFVSEERDFCLVAHRSKRNRCSNRLIDWGATVIVALSWAAQRRRVWEKQVQTSLTIGLNLGACRTKFTRIYLPPSARARTQTGRSLGFGGIGARKVSSPSRPWLPTPPPPHHLSIRFQVNAR